MPPTPRFARVTGAVAGRRTPRAKSPLRRIARLAVPVAAVTGLLAFQAAGATVTAAGPPTWPRTSPWRLPT